jgi:DHA1 family bicyclomycin/chloramphenicol resistance-like MFS transporter
VLVQALRLTPTRSACLFAAVMLGQMAGGFAGSRLVVRLGIERMVRLAAYVVLLSGALLAILVFAGPPTGARSCCRCLATSSAAQLLVPNATAAALTPFPQMAGAASSLLGVLPFSLGALVSAVLGAAFDGTCAAACTGGRTRRRGSHLRANGCCSAPQRVWQGPPAHDRLDCAVIGAGSRRPRRGARARDRRAARS